MNSCVDACTPGVTRIITGATTPRVRARRATSSISPRESTTIRPSPESRARVISAADLLLPCSAIRAGSMPARRATASSPPEEVSTFRPSSRTQRTTSVVRKDLPA